MKRPDECMNINDVREEIDIIDDQLAKLICLRATYVKKAAEFKHSDNHVRDRERTDNILAKVKIIALQQGFSSKTIVGIYTRLLESFYDIELEQWGRIK